jgi:subtilase family serine protease
MKHRLIPAATMLAAATALATAGLVTLPAHGSSAARHVLPDVSPSWASASHDRGAVASSKVISGRVYLASRDQGGLDRFVAAVSTPGSPQYGHYLSPAAAAARFGSRPGAGNQVASWLRSVGLRVTGANQHYVSFSGSATKVGAAFGVGIHNFSVAGKNVYSAVGNATVPSSVAANVLTVTGLSSQLVPNHPMLTGDLKPAKQAKPTAKAFPCSDYEGQKMAKDYPKAYGKVQPYAICGYGPQQYAGAYGATGSGFTGKGITVAVVDAYALPTMTKDLDKWNKARDWKAMKKGQYKEYIPNGTGYDAGWAGEEALDIEAIHSMAPDAKINYVAGQTASTGALMDALQLIVDKKLGDAVNNSWEGGTDSQQGEAQIKAFEQVFKMGATEGIGFYFSSGDGGGGGTLYPSVDPYVTSVGGSATGIDKKNNIMWETDWETDYSALNDKGDDWTPKPPGDFTSGGGGGTSVVFKQPSWQKGVVPKKFSEANGSTPMRTSPDIGANGDPTTGFLEGYSTQQGSDWVYAEGRIGGTSLSSPLIVGMQAVAEEAAGGKAIGFANPAIYKLYDSKALHDVVQDPFGNGDYIAHVRMATLNGSTVVALATAGQAKDGGLAAVKGYDTTTGVGTPTVNYYKMLLK